jgi:GT2 family glycosyltransferase
MVTWVDGQTHKMNLPAIDSANSELSLEEHGMFPINRASFVSICVSSRAVRECGLPLGDMFLWFDDVEFTGRIARAAPCYLVSRSLAVHKTKSNAGVPHFRDANRQNYRRLAMGYRNHVVYRRQNGNSGIPMALFTLMCGAKILLLYLRFGPDWNRISWVWRGLFRAQQPFSLDAYAKYLNQTTARAR